MHFIHVLTKLHSILNQDLGYFYSNQLHRFRSISIDSFHYQNSKNVTATANVKIFEAKIRSNLTWHSNMLQTKDLSEKQIKNQKSPPARDDEKRRRRNQSLEHGDVPIFGVYTT